MIVDLWVHGPHVKGRQSLDRMYDYDLGVPLDAFLTDQQAVKEAIENWYQWPKGILASYQIVELTRSVNGDQTHREFLCHHPSLSKEQVEALIGPPVRS